MSSGKPILTRQQTNETRDYLNTSLNNLDTKMTPKQISDIIEECSIGRRVDPMVDVDSHGKANIAKNLKSQGILENHVEEELYNLLKSIKKNIPGKKDYERLKILFVNATEFGGGVAEMRPNNALFMKEYNVDGDWAVIDGCDQFYKTTVHIHEGIQNPDYEPLKQEEYEILSIVSVLNFSRFHSLNIFSKYDLIWIDDPQPLGMIPMIKALYPEIPLIWRCHVHSEPEPSIRTYLSNVLEGIIDPDQHKITSKYMLDNHGVDFRKFPKSALKVDSAVFHLKEFSEGLKLSDEIPIHIMGPAIDPLSFKNMPVSQEFILATLAHYNIIKAKTHDEGHQMKLHRRTTMELAIKYAPELNYDDDNEKDGLFENKIPPIVLEVSRYDPYKGPLEVIVSFIEAMHSLKGDTEISKFIKDNCRFVFAASTPGDNPSGAQILRNLELFLDNIDILKEKELKSLKRRIFLLSLKDQRRTEILRKKIFEKIWEKEEHKKEMMVGEVLIQSATSPLHEILEKLRQGNNPLISEDVSKSLLDEGEEIIKANSAAYFTPEQCITMADCITKLQFQDAAVWSKIKGNCLSGKEINHLEVNALQTAATVRCQFSSKEGFGLVVSEAMVKHEECNPPVNGLMVATTVGGVKSQVNKQFAIPVDYPNNEVVESLHLYNTMTETDVNNPKNATELYRKISSRKSVVDFAEAIVKAFQMPRNERELKSKSARNFILSNFAIHSNVLNIFKAVERVVEHKAAAAAV